MRRTLVAAGTGLIALGLLTGCGRSTDGTVAMTTEPGPPLTSETTTSRKPVIPGLPEIPGLPDITIPGFPTQGSDTPDVPAPPDALTMTCADYNQLDEATQKAVVNAVLEGDQSILGPDNIEIAKSLADAVCQFLVDSTVREVLLGGPVP
ncbi:hypothetical protein [Mycolicibacterium bacteremicum]|uniref:Uncharacterized protein n=1 Tax=Mycolicibacterium bacteremicum TaxID=564198 RepID=A0A1W9YR54_MYCBA|nr:hypothetical protein [Mycolicibacterium bacteremicum]MCV7430091.1 hypothetical protein [Mycolicibacterium bacteremicum]ORA02571.1 hypothetical protein BST17_23140 [Mycolicibacterium bacteremicum]